VASRWARRRLPNRLGLFGRDEGGSCPLLRSFADPERIANLDELGLGVAEPGFKFARSRAQLGVRDVKSLELATHCVGELDVFLRALARPCGVVRGELSAVAGRCLTDLENDGVK
jgi:hypothetical protein